MASRSVIETSELPITRYANESTSSVVHCTRTLSITAAIGSMTTTPTAYWTRLAVSGWCSTPKRFSYSVADMMPASAPRALPAARRADPPT